MSELTRPLKIFFSYAHEDEYLRIEIEKHLSLSRRKRDITIWFDREIQPGQEWKEEIDTNIYRADIILLLISASFLYSDYCYGIEMQTALELHEIGATYVIPIIIRSVNWKGAPFSHLQVLPTDGKPIESSYWYDRDAALTDVASGIDRVIKTHHTQTAIRGLKKTTQEDFSRRLTREETQGIWKENTDQTSIINSSQKILIELRKKGYALLKNEQYQDALLAFEEVITYDHNNGVAYIGKGISLLCLSRNSEALIAFNRAVSLKPKGPDVYYYRGVSFERLERYEKALADYNAAIRINPNIDFIYESKGDLLHKLDRDDEAVTAYDYAISLNPTKIILFKKKASALLFSGYPLKSLVTYSLYTIKRFQQYIINLGK